MHWTKLFSLFFFSLLALCMFLYVRKWTQTFCFSIFFWTLQVKDMLDSIFFYVLWCVRKWIIFCFCCFFGLKVEDSQFCLTSLAFFSTRSGSGLKYLLACNENTTHDSRWRLFLGSVAFIFTRIIVHTREDGSRSYSFLLPSLAKDVSQRTWFL